MQGFSRCGLVVASIVVLTGCGGASKGAPEGKGTPDAAAEAIGAGPLDGSPGDAATDDASETGDAAPRNAACTPTSQQTGTVVDTNHGRLDGTLVYVVPPIGDADDAGYYEDGFDGGGNGDGGFHHGQDGGFDAGPNGALRRCNGDSSHVHLQISVTGNVYDVAVDIGAAGDEVGTYQEAIALPGGAWAEGWHVDNLSYGSLALRATSFPLASPSANATLLESLLEGTTQISIFCTGYTEGNGCHDVHYQDGTTNDGAIVLDPLAVTPTVLFFRFVSQTF
jgi:hypothetical protein